MIVKKSHIYLLIIFFTLLYVFFPTINSGIDAYGYAALVKYNINLFLSHHLLYNALGWVLLKLIGDNIDVLPFMIAINGIVGGLILWVFYLILKKSNVTTQNAFWAIALSASTFGFSRFCTENETYIIPILFSLIATYYFYNIQSKTNYFLVINISFWGSIACLFHQIHVWWWLAFLIAFLLQKQYKSAFLYVIPSFLVPITYYFVNLIYFGKSSFPDLIHFVFADYIEGRAASSIGFKNIVLFAINIVRTFVQIHGNIVLIISKYFIFDIIGFVGIGLMLFGGIQIFKSNCLKLASNPIKNALLIAIFFHLFFSLISYGNAEFMAMIPVLTILLLANSDFEKLKWAIIGLFIWNFSMAIIPQNLFDFEGNMKTYKKIKNQSVYVFQNKALFENIHFYHTGVDPAPNMFKINNPNLEQIIDSCLANNIPVYTDVFNESVLNRQTIIANKLGEIKVFEKYIIEIADSINTSFQKKYLFSVRNK